SPERGLANRYGPPSAPRRAEGRVRIRNIYDVWLPMLAPSEALVKEALRAEDDKAWRAFARKYRTEMNAPDPSRVLDTLAALSHQTNFSVGCYCKEESRCHRSVLRELLASRGASLAD